MTKKFKRQVKRRYHFRRCRICKKFVRRSAFFNLCPEHENDQLMEESANIYHADMMFDLIKATPVVNIFNL